MIEAKGTSVLANAPNMPHWIERTLHITPGRDPLGLHTITIDRIMPQLVPGILALSRRARYFSFYPFLLCEYRQQRLPASNNALSDFIKRREFEYALAVQLCPHGCGSSPSAVVGKERAGPAVRRGGDRIDRQESVESRLGGYGLYYRTPLTDLGLIAPTGTLLRDQPTPVDVLANERAEALAEAFYQAVAQTTYYQRYMRGVDPIPVEVLREFSECACLCRLPDFPTEQLHLRQALFSPLDSLDFREVDQRRRSFALFLSLLTDDPLVVYDDAAFRSAIWNAFGQFASDHSLRSETLAQWAALVAKEYMQESFSSMWADTCRLGLTKQPPEGLSIQQRDRLLRHDLLGARHLNVDDAVIDYDEAMPTVEFGEAAAAATQDRTLEELRSWVVQSNTAITGLAFLLILYKRLPKADGVAKGWLQVGRQQSDHQLGSLRLGELLQEHLLTNPTLAETLSMLVQRFVLSAHESIAYSKLPEFTFRFRWENNRLRFYELDHGRFGLTDIRRDSMARLTQDLGLWKTGDTGVQLTEAGHHFIEEVFA